MKTPSGRKRKGSKLERDIVKLFEAHGLKARRQPLSGALQDFPHDVQVEVPGYGRLIIEAKSWKHGWRTGDAAMGKAELLVMKRDYGEPMVYLSLATFAAIIKTLVDGEP